MDANLLFILRFKFSHIWVVGSNISRFWVLSDMTFIISEYIFYDILCWISLVLFFPHSSPNSGHFYKEHQFLLVEG